MIAGFRHNLIQHLLGTVQSSQREQFRAFALTEAAHAYLRARLAHELLHIGESQPAGYDAEAMIECGELTHQHPQRRFPQRSAARSRWLLKAIETVED